MFYLKILGMILWSLGATFVLFPFFWVPQAFPRWVRTVARGWLWITGIRSEVENGELLNAVRPCVIMGNHQSALDFATFGLHMPDRCTAVGKREIAFIPLFGWYFALSGGFLIHRANRERAVELLRAVGRRLREKGLAVGIMPEGTRNLSGRGLLPFKKGPFHLAVEAQADIVVIVSSPLEPIANFGARRLKRGVVRLKVMGPVSVQGKTEKDIEVLMAEVRAAMESVLHSTETTVW